MKQTLPIEFDVLTEPGTLERNLCALHQLFQYSRELLAGLHADVESGQLSDRFCVRAASGNNHALNVLCDAVQDGYQKQMESPFEGVNSIAGGVWSGTDFSNHNDALLKLRFSMGTSRLPMHIHEFSDRVIFVVSGAGEFSVASNSQDVPHDAIHSVPVSKGDILSFSSGVLHTFKTDQEELLLLSYHSPFIDLADPRQFTVPGDS